MPALTQEKLKELLSYDPETGVFRWEVRKCQKVRVGSIAGYQEGRGYTQIMIDGKNHRAHRLAWLYVYGYFPETDLDHKDKNKSNNKINNLREASRQCNMRNVGNFKHNKSGVKGVYLDYHKNKWVAQVTIENKQFYLGSYEDFDEAVCTRLAVEQCLGWSGCDSSSPAFKYVQNYIIPTHII
jgi:hypothetical protein